MPDSSTKRCGPPVVGQRHDARQRARRLHDRELAVAAERILARSRTMKFRLLFRMRGNGCAGIEARAGSAPARPRARSSAPATSRSAGVQSARPSRRMPCACSAGSSTSFRQRYCSCDQRCARSWMACSCSGIDRPSGAELARSRARCAASGPRRGSRRTRRDCSRRCTGTSRSSSGTDSSSACASTRWLNSSSDSSRLMKWPGALNWDKA